MAQPLVIIDMQDTFLSADEGNYYSRCIKNVARQIKLAKRRGDHILVVEYVHGPHKVINKKSCATAPTTSSLNNLLKNYKNKVYVYKRDNDGGLEILQTLKSKKIPHKNVRVCGVYANYCVRETVTTMAEKMNTTKIHLVKNAISCHEGRSDGKKDAIKNMTTFKNVKVMK